MPEFENETGPKCSACGDTGWRMHHGPTWWGRFACDECHQSGRNPDLLSRVRASLMLFHEKLNAEGEGDAADDLAALLDEFDAATPDAHQVTKAQDCDCSVVYSGCEKPDCGRVAYDAERHQVGHQVDQIKEVAQEVADLAGEPLEKDRERFETARQRLYALLAQNPSHAGTPVNTKRQVRPGAAEAGTYLTKPCPSCGGTLPEASWTTTGKNCPVTLGVCQDSACWALGEKPCKRWNAGERYSPPTSCVHVAGTKPEGGQ